jgi:hypothetical protein
MDRRRPGKRKDGGLPRGLDIEALNGIAECGGFVLVQGDSVPLVRPLDADASQLEFDRALCASGLKRFVRAAMRDEWPEVMEMPRLHDHVLVREEVPGVRVRLSLTVQFLDPRRN